MKQPQAKNDLNVIFAFGVTSILMTVAIFIYTAITP